MSRVVRQIALGLIVLASGNARADATSDEWKALAGTWKVEKAVISGQDMTEGLRSAVLVIEEGKYSLQIAGMTDRGTLSLDLTRTPKVMTIKGTDGPNKDRSYPAIYEMDKDTLKVCYNLDGKDPPTAFESKAGTTVLMATYKREKK